MSRSPQSIKPENRLAAKEAGLSIFPMTQQASIGGVMGTGSFTLTSAGKKITDDETLLAIRYLAIPPAYRDVWISPDPRGHIQAVGRNDRGRKQYHYHEKWRQVRRKQVRADARFRQVPTQNPPDHHTISNCPACPNVRCWRRW